MPSTPSRPTQKVAIVCDWLTGIGGAERVVYELHRLYPKAPIYTSQYDPSKLDWFKDADVRTGWLQKLPKSLRKFLPPLRAWYFSHLNLEEYSLVISSSGAEAKGIHAAKDATHITYCHSPTHYYWTRYDEYMRSPGFGVLNPLARLGLRLLVGPMKRWDYRAAQRPTRIIANSHYTQANIKKYYDRDSVVVFPPVETDRFKPAANGQAASQRKRHGFVVAGRQTPYKNIHLAVQACTQLKLPLTVIGNGPDHDRLVAMAGPTVSFKTNVNDADIAAEFAAAEAFIFPNADDFGIVSVEAMAAGTPLIALQAGGALDTVQPGKTGLFFPEPTVKSLCAALQQCGKYTWDNSYIRRHAEQYSVVAFQAAMRAALDKPTTSTKSKH